MRYLLLAFDTLLTLALMLALIAAANTGTGWSLVWVAGLGVAALWRADARERDNRKRADDRKRIRPFNEGGRP